MTPRIRRQRLKIQMRINVTGNAGSGKSTLAKKISKELNLPLIEMDRLIWKSGWERVPHAICREQVSALIAQQDWVFDGVSHQARQQANLIVFLDYPRHICVWHCVKRNWRYLFRSRPGLPAGCPEWKTILALLRTIKRFPKKTRLAILKDMADTNAATAIIQNSADLARFMKTLPRLSLQATHGVTLQGRFM